jgi:16S rRNA (guanine527-N7)-methyltransferase
LPPVRKDEQESYSRYYALLREWNEKINLVSRKSIDSSFAFHFADSVWLAHSAHPHLGSRRLLDFGSGAGFPGMVFAIRYPDAEVVLYEKLAKRRLFLQDVIDKLSLRKVRLEGAFPEGRVADLVTARAVLPPDELFAFMKSRLHPEGRLVTSWGGAKDLPTAPPPFLALETLSYTLPEDAGSRKLVVYSVVPRGTFKG